MRLRHADPARSRLIVPAQPVQLRDAIQLVAQLPGGALRRLHGECDALDLSSRQRLRPSRLWRSPILRRGRGDEGRRNEENNRE
jgi:hypothetical protein